MRGKETQLTSWGRNRTATMTAFRPERGTAIAKAIQAAGTTGAIAYGDGRNYGDLGICADGTAILTSRLDRILSFDETTGAIVLEPGLTFGELYAFASKRGFLPPVTPGTSFVTVGGGVASDIHGKNHDREGSLGEHIDWLEITLADGACVRTSREERPELFAATLGGCGLTGVIAGIGMRLKKQRANAVETREYSVRNLDHFFELMTEHRAKSTYTVGWIDALKKGRDLGRGIFQCGEPVEAPELKERQKSISVPFTFPNWTLNPVSVAAFNALYYHRVPAKGRSRIVPYHSFHHPLDSVQNWNRFYGGGGFYQFQCIIPDDAAFDGVRTLLEKVSAAGAASFLGVLKTFGKEGIGHLSFPRPGVTLSLDIPARPKTDDLMHQLEAVTLDHGGRLYLAKDAVMSAEGFARMYPRLDEFREVLATYDPDGRFNSEMAKRLRIRGTS